MKAVSKIATLRQRAGLTQRELSGRIGVSENTIQNWEQGKAGLEHIERLIKLCKVLRCAPEDLIEYVPDPEGELSIDLHSPISCKEEWKKLMTFLLKTGQGDGIELMAIVNARLTQFRLDSRYEPKEIIDEAFIRGYQALIHRKIIQHPLSWLRGACHKIIMEFSRDDEKYKNTDPLTLSETIVSPYEDSDIDKKDETGLKTLFEATMQKLKPEDKELIDLRVYKEKKWDEIAQHYRNQGKKINTSTLRKRWERLQSQIRSLVESNPSE